jgi:hypothetical protein
MATIKVRWNVAELANVMTLFNVQRVYRSTATDAGPWTEITGPGTRPALVSGQTAYYFDDTAGAATYWYSIDYYHTGTAAASERSTAIRGTFAGVAYLTVDDLYALVGSRRVTELFDDDGDGSLTNDLASLYDALSSAEAEMAARLRRGWSADAIPDLVATDRALRRHAAWIALELASERRPEFLAADGKGAFWAQYERALQHADLVSKGRLRAPAGEAVAGTGAQVGAGVVQPTPDADTPRFLFAPDRDNPTGGGGF